MSAVFYMMVGVAGSGKSFIARDLGCPIVSSDAIRAELFGSEEDQSHNGEVFNELHKRIKNYLANGQSCVYDATNLSRKRRKNFLKELPKDVKKIAVVAATEIDVILEQNANRVRHVPEEVIWRMYKEMSLPRLDEGWDSIRMIPNPKNKKTLGEYLFDAYGVDHDNPHHQLDIFHHMLEASKYASDHAAEKGLDKNLKHLARTAALFHDIGKPVVKSRMKYNGKEDDHSHFYNHHEVGAYMVACCVGQFSSKQYDFYAALIVLIQWHMEYYFRDNFIDEFERLYGSEMRAVYDLLHEADMAAH